jgi:two-component system phosphate regulon sensor histidine kinase PhoR
VATAVREFQTQDSIARSANPEHAQNLPLRLEPIRYSPTDRGWTLIALHRKGSVEAAVAALYRRNLTVDFGVLLVLAAMIATMVISVRRAHQLAQMRMDFVASVSHELRTPLTGIVSSAQNIADGLVSNKERAIQYGAAILGQAEQLAELVEEILLFSSTERGRIYNFQWLDVTRVIAAALAGTVGQIRSAGVRIEQTTETDLPQVWGDFKALTQCLQNLIVNAVKYGGNGGWIGIFTSVVAKPNFTWEVVVTVEDKGLGISSEDLKRIFDPFYRSPAVTGEQIHGSGLGLAIVKSIAEAMGGSLTVQSDLGKGSSFSLHLPAEKKSSRGTASYPAPVEAAGTR